MKRNEIKNRLRHRLRIEAGRLDCNYKKEASRRISEKLLCSPAFAQSDSVFIYAGTENEPDTSEIILAALSCGKKVYLPKCGDNHTMKAIRIYSTDELEPGYMGIPEPVGNEEADSIGLAVIPCISASADCRRLGHGAGFYDRFLARKDMKKICLCFGRLMCDGIPMDENDVFMDEIITE